MIIFCFENYLLMLESIDYIVRLLIVMCCGRHVILYLTISVRTFDIKVINIECSNLLFFIPCFKYQALSVYCFRVSSTESVITTVKSLVSLLITSLKSPEIEFSGLNNS